MEEGKEQVVVSGEKPLVKPLGKKSLLVPVMGIIIVLLASVLIVTATPLRDVLFAVKTAPEIDLEVAGDPQLEESGIYRFEVSAKVSGNPAPEVTFNRDDSLGEAGTNRAVILLAPGETFMVTAAAKNALGKSEASLELKTDTETVGEDSEDPDKEPDKDPPVKTTGTIEGYLVYPSDHVPLDLIIVAKNTDNNQEYTATGVIQNSKYATGFGFLIEVPPGNYQLYAQSPGDSHKAYYDVFVQSGYTINSYEKIVVTIAAGQHVSDAVVGNWWNAVPPNRDPVVTAIRFDPERIFTGWTYTVTADCSDPDGDPLTFEWSATGGAITGATANPMTWKAPDTKGDYTITVKVRDGRGGTATASRKVTAGTFTVLPLDPKLTSVTLEPKSIGTVRSTGSFSDQILNVGDTVVNDSRQGFATFSLNSISNSATIKSARIETVSYTKSGDPFGSLGALRVFIHNYGTLGPEDYTPPPVSGAIVRFLNEAALNNAAGQELNSLGVTGIQNALASNQFQIRLQFNTRETDGDSQVDGLQAQFRLVISYTP